LPECCGLATAGAEIGRPAYIVACRRRSADGIVTFSGRDSDLVAFPATLATRSAKLQLL
jgi:hypothetical protein